jgi:hypothetical protein
MTDIAFTIPLALTVSQIARANPAIGDDEARELAQEMHSIIDMVQAAYAAHPPDKATLTARLPGAAGCLPYETAVAYELGDVIDSIRNTIFGHWPGGNHSIEAGDLSCWLMERLTDLDDSDILYFRYLLVHDRVQGTDLASILTLKEDGAALP